MSHTCKRKGLQTGFKIIEAIIYGHDRIVVSTSHCEIIYLFNLILLKVPETAET